MPLGKCIDCDADGEIPVWQSEVGTKIYCRVCFRTWRNEYMRKHPLSPEARAARRPLPWYLLIGADYDEDDDNSEDGP